MNEVFYLRQTYYNPRNFNVFVTDNPCNKYLLNSSIYRANELWQTLPSKIKNCASLQLCKDKIKTCRCDMSDLPNIYCQCWLLLVCFSVTQNRLEAKLQNCRL